MSKASVFSGTDGGMRTCLPPTTGDIIGGGAGKRELESNSGAMSEEVEARRESYDKALQLSDSLTSALKL